ncbi:MAG: hypothetical protein IKN54_07420, partial [Lachnospiraceae bacterium]|nr:hypothetical protein [Lachnospiraceae bacterium]
ASGNNYLNATGTASLGTGNSVTGDTPTRWFFTNPGQGNSGTIYTIINGIRYYLLDATSNNGNLRLSNNQSNATSWYWTNSYLRAGNNGRYIYYNNSWFNSSWQGRINAQSLTITEHQPFEHSDIMLEDTTSSVYEYSTVTEPAEYGYMPLSAMQTYPYTVNTQNTGYIISGGYETSSYNADIRVSEYYKSDITTGLTAQTNAGVVKTSGVKTVDASGIHNINTANLVKYESSRKQFDAVLNGTTNVYGLHFMNSQISKDRLIVTPKVMIEGTQYTDYEMPEDSIDFNVHQKGYINFFAGTYFSGNNSFFSLHIIERDSNQKITAIKEIKEIWKSSDQSKEYIYYLKDGNNYEWSATKTSDYSLAFDTDWITHPGTNTQLGDTNLYYFEIPVNAGEFALGSVEGRTGAYLLYLDIAANAQRVYRATVIENFEETTNTYSFPVGVTFKNTIINPTSTETVIPSALAVMPTGTSSVNATVTDDTHITLSNGNVCYIADGVTVNNSLTYKDITTTPVASTTTRIRRTTYYDYNVAKNLYTVTVVEVRKVDDGAKSVTINAWNTGADWDIESNNATQIATMTTGFAPNIGSSTNNVAINTGEAQKLEYTAVDEIYCYLINVSSDDDAQTLRIDKNAFEGTLSVSNELYQFSYAIKDNDDETDGATIDYDYDFNLVMNADALDDNGLFAYSNRRYDISVDSNETIHTKVVTPVTNNNYNVTLTPTPN